MSFFKSNPVGQPFASPAIIKSPTKVDPGVKRSLAAGRRQAAAAGGRTSTIATEGGAQGLQGGGSGLKRLLGN